MPRLSIVVASVFLIGGCHGMPTKDGAPGSKTTPPGTDTHHERVVLRYLWPALNYGQMGGRIYYTAVCPPSHSLDPPFVFPDLDVRPPQNGKVGVAAARDIFRNVPDVSVKETSRGIIRIRIGSVPDDVLRVRISKLTLMPDEQYTEWAAEVRIENAPELRSAMQKLRIRSVSKTIDAGLVQPAEGLPHLPAVLNNVTVDEALDLVAKTFSGVVIYEFCTSGDLFDIRFANDYYINSTWNE